MPYLKWSLNCGVAGVCRKGLALNFDVDVQK